MDLTFSEVEERFRGEARAWLEANVPAEPLPSGDTAEGFALHKDWERKLFDARWAVVSWPEAYGGRDASLWEWLIFEEEYYRAGAPQRVTQNGIFLLAPTLFEFGTKEQQDRILPAMASGEETWCQGWSEPDAGSDLAAIRSRAMRDDAAGGWRLTGQKTWTTRGAFCDRMFGLFRTDPDAGRHRGLTYFLVDLNAEGVTVRGFGRLDGDEGFADVFLEDVFVPDHDVLGDVDQGWSVAMATTGSERGLTLRSPGRFSATVDRLVELFDTAENPADDLRAEVVQGWMDAEAYRLQTLWTVTRLSDGERPGPESSLTKLFWSELDVRLHETALVLVGPELEGEWTKGYQFALAGPIYAGTNEIQRNVVAERVLGLPRRSGREIATMRFAFTDEQLAMRDTVRDFLEKECPPTVVRDAWTNDTGRSGLWRKLGDIGVLGVLAPEDQGGFGGDFLDLVLLLEETGRAALPEPVVEHAAVAVPELDDATDAASGAITVTAVGYAPHVLYADSADLVLHGGRFVEPRTLELEHRETVDHSRRLYTLGQPEMTGALDTANRGALGTAAQLLGLAQHMLDATVEYAKQRHQFGVSIGSFQAIKHKLADVRLALEFAGPVVYRAAHSVAHDDPDRSVHCSMAKAYASDAALLAARHTLQVHGAIGYSYEHDLHLWMKRAWALAAAWGDAASHRKQVGHAILGPERREA